MFPSDTTIFALQVDKLNDLHRADLTAAVKGEPAVHKLANIGHIKRLINRRGFQMPFLMDRGKRF